MIRFVQRGRPMENKEQFSRFILFIALAVGILVIWQKIFPPPVKPPPPEITQRTDQGKQGTSTQEKKRPHSQPDTASPIQQTTSSQLLLQPTTDTLMISTPLVQYNWDLKHGGLITQTLLNRYTGPAGTETENDTLTVGNQEKTFYLTFSDSQLAAFNGAPFAVVQNNQAGLILQQETKDFKVTKYFTPDQESYAFEWKIKIESPKPLNGTLGSMGIHIDYAIPGKLTSSLNVNEVAGYIQDERKSVVLGGDPMGCGGDPSATEKEVWSGEVDWLSIGDRYFMQALIPRGKFNPDIIVDSVDPKPGAIVYSQLSYPVFFKDSREVIIEGQGYFGPKTIDLLKVIPKLNSSIDLGWFRILAEPIMKFLNIIYNNVISNYGIAIILLTLLVRILMIPIMQKQMKSMKGMQTISPQMAKLKEKYANDKQRLNVEMMQLMKEHKVNPLGGCAPMLLQMPIFFALWRALGSTADLYNAPFFLWIEDLSAQDPYYVLPIGMAVMMIIQQITTPQSATMDKMQKRMFLLMPVFFSFIMLKFPAGLCLYMFVSTAFGIAQQLFIRRGTNSENNSKKKLSPATTT